MLNAMSRKNTLMLFFFIGFFFSQLIVVEALPEANVKGKHFIVYYDRPVGQSWARSVLREAERYYDKIASQIGYSRYQNFWTWELRVKIIIYANQERFIKETGISSWSTGVSIRDEKVFSSKAILTFKQEKDFLIGVLPHEVSHLMLQDFLEGSSSIPVWFDEGIAQAQEIQKKNKALPAMKVIVGNNQQIPFNAFLNHSIRFETDAAKVTIFYIQSLSIIEFMIQKYGNAKFGQLVLAMKDGKTFEQALKSVYIFTIDTVEDLEEKWLRYVRG